MAFITIESTLSQEPANEAMTLMAASIVVELKKLAASATRTKLIAHFNALANNQYTEEQNRDMIIHFNHTLNNLYDWCAEKNIEIK